MSNNRGTIFSNVESKDNNEVKFELTAPSKEFIDNKLKELAGNPKAVAAFIKEYLENTQSQLNQMADFVEQTHNNLQMIYTMLQNTIPDQPEVLSQLIVSYIDAARLKSEVNALESMFDVANQAANRRGGGP